MRCSTTRGSASRRIATAARSTRKRRRGGVANENMYTMHEPFLALHARRHAAGAAAHRLPASGSPTANPPLPTLGPRLRNSFPFFGDEWLKTGGIGEFTGGGVDGLRAIAAGRMARRRSRAEPGRRHQPYQGSRDGERGDSASANLRWIISHIRDFPVDLANRCNAMGMGVLVGWGPLRNGTNVGPPYRMLMTHAHPEGLSLRRRRHHRHQPVAELLHDRHGQEPAGQPILGDQTLTRQETLWLATAANKWFIEEDDLGSIEAGNHADLAVLDRDYFTVPDTEITRTRSLLTMAGGRILHDDLGRTRG